MGCVDFIRWSLGSERRFALGSGFARAARPLPPPPAGQPPPPPPTQALPDGVLYSSRESHYSVFKAARMYRMDAAKVDTLSTGEIDYDHFAALLAEEARGRGRPAIVNVNIGTTVKGAVDDVDKVRVVGGVVGLGVGGWWVFWVWFWGGLGRRLGFGRRGCWFIWGFGARRRCIIVLSI